MLFLFVCEKLAGVQMEFGVHFVGQKPVVTISNNNVTNEQLRVLTDLGATMTPQGFMILTEMTVEDQVKS